MEILMPSMNSSPVTPPDLPIPTRPREEPPVEAKPSRPPGAIPASLEELVVDGMILIDDRFEEY
jgi:hypothetical protein